MASGSDTKDTNQKEHNYIRLNLLVVKLSTFVLKARFDHAVPPDQLHHRLNQFVGTINYGRNKKIISQKQYEVLFPQTSPPQSEKFDVTLLVYLLRHLCGMDAKCKWWKVNDNTEIPNTVVVEVADIVRIRNVRNEIQHLQKASIEQDEYEVKWSLTEEAMLRLGMTCNLPGLKKEIETIKNQPFETVKEKTSVIMQTHGLDDDYGYLDYDLGVEDDYDDYDDYDVAETLDDYEEHDVGETFDDYDDYNDNDPEGALDDYDDYDTGGTFDDYDDNASEGALDDYEECDVGETFDDYDDNASEGALDDYEECDVGETFDDYDDYNDNDPGGALDDYDDYDTGGTFDDYVDNASEGALDDCDDH